MKMRVALIVALIVSLVGCSGIADGSGFELTEFAIDGAATLGVGRNTIEVRNTGEFPHTLVVTDSDGTVVQATTLIQPDESVEVDLDLDPGRYSFTCRIVTQTEDGRVVDHYEEGMATMVTVEG